jgi:DNA-binding transcriptional LysR family regulator
LKRLRGQADRWHLRRGPDLVRVSVTPTFARLWLLRRVRDLERGSPPLRLEIVAQSGFADVESGEADIAIRYRRRVHAGEDSDLILPETLFPVACAEVAEELGPDPTPEQILDRPLLHDVDATKWRAWCDATLEHRLTVGQRDRRFEDYGLTLVAASAGLGIALSQSPVADQRLGELGLQRLTTVSAPSPFAYYLVQPRNELRSAVAAFRERLLAEISASSKVCA